MDDGKRKFLKNIGLLGLLSAGTASTSSQAGWGGRTEQFRNNTFVIQGNSGGRYQMYEVREMANGEYQMIWKRC